MKKIYLLFLLILLTSCSNDISNSTMNKIDDLQAQIEEQNKFIDLLLESNSNLKQEINDLKNEMLEKESIDESEKIVIFYDAIVKLEDRLMVSLKDTYLVPIPNEDVDQIGFVPRGTLLKVKETASVDHKGVWTKWYRIEAPLYDVAKNVEGWLSEEYLENYDTSNTSIIVNVKCKGPVEVYLDNHNNLGAMSTKNDDFQGVIVEQKEEYVKIALGRGEFYWVSKENIALHYEELIN